VLWICCWIDSRKKLHSADAEQALADAATSSTNADNATPAINLSNDTLPQPPPSYTLNIKRGTGTALALDGTASASLSVSQQDGVARTVVALDGAMYDNVRAHISNVHVTGADGAMRMSDGAFDERANHLDRVLNVPPPVYVESHGDVRK